MFRPTSTFSNWLRCPRHSSAWKKYRITFHLFIYNNLRVHFSKFICFKIALLLQQMLCVVENKVVLWNSILELNLLRPFILILFVLNHLVFIIILLSFYFKFLTKIWRKIHFCYDLNLRILKLKKCFLCIKTFITWVRYNFSFLVLHKSITVG